MERVVAVIAAGAMGSAVGGFVAAGGARVLTALDGRSAATVERAQAAGMRAASDEEIAGADIILSIVPPAEAVGLAERLAPVLAGSPRKGVYADLNAVSPRTVARVAAVVEPSGWRFVDGGIVGPPPAVGRPGTVLYLSGPDAEALLPLRDCGLDVRDIGRPVGAASALKLSYAGLNKGLMALATVMMTGAARGGVADLLGAELAASQKPILARAERGIPDMVPKAYRWVAEMREIADFLGEDEAAAMMFEGAARLYERIAADGDDALAALEAVLAGARE